MFASATTKKRPLTQGEFRAMYSRPESFTDLLPWRDYLPEEKAFLLEDGRSVGAFFEIRAVACEARPHAWLESLRNNFQNVLSALPENTEAHWVLQLYLQDEPSLDALGKTLREYVHPRARGTAYTRAYLAEMDEHLEMICRHGGLFVDTQTTGSEWRGQTRRVRAVLYRRTPKQKRNSQADMSPVEELNEACSRFFSALGAAGVAVHRGNGHEFYRWMASWFNPSTPIDQLMKNAPYPDAADDQPYGRDLAEMMMFSRPKSENGVWWFDGMPHLAVTVQSLRNAPKIGHITAERQMGDHTYAFFDRVPEGTTMAMTITAKPRSQIVNHLAEVNKSATGDSAEARIARDETDLARHEMALGNSLYPCEITWYLRAPDLETLRYNATVLNAKLQSNDLQPVDPKNDPLAMDSYIRNLPMNYDPAIDKSSSSSRRRSRLWYAKQIANLFPFYGRSTGTGHPGVVGFSRSAEGFTFDPLNEHDRKKNAFALVLGPPGSGKSATTIYMLRHYLAILRPRLFILEAGNSFGLFADDCRNLGLTVNHIKLRPDSDVSLPPFSDALKLIPELTTLNPEATIDENDDAPIKADDDDKDKRDYLGEMEIVARLMITGGEAKEEARMIRADKLSIRLGIMEAAKTTQAEGRDCVITSDVVTGLRAVAAREIGARRERISEMADSMAVFSSGLAGHFFNRPGTRWPDADVTIVDLGTLAREGYEDQLAVAVVGLLSAINDIAERDQHSGRPTIVPIDEAHLITTNPLLAPYVVKMAKMWRKLGCWLRLITQNLGDFPDASRKMLNMLEWWICLTPPKDEVEQIARFRSLTNEQRSLLMAAKKENGKYAEAIVLADGLEGLFRIVSPALCLALAQTEQHEKAARRALMDELGCTELEAAYVIAGQIKASRGLK